MNTKFYYFCIREILNMKDIFIISDLSFLAFPLNAILCLLWAVAVYLLWKNARNSKLVKFLLSPTTVFISIALFASACLLIGFTGKRNITVSWTFILILLFFQTVLAMVILRGWRKGRIRFKLLHAGLLLAAASAFWGAPDTQTYRVRLHRHSENIKPVPMTEAYRMDGSRVWLDYNICLDDFVYETSDSGVPVAYNAYVTIDGKPVELRVNHPYSRRFGEDIYLTGYDDVSGSCVLQVVYEPWKYTALAGIFMMLAGALLLFLKGPQKEMKS